MILSLVFSHLWLLCDLSMHDAESSLMPHLSLHKKCHAMRSTRMRRFEIIRMHRQCRQLPGISAALRASTMEVPSLVVGRGLDKNQSRARKAISNVVRHAVQRSTATLMQTYITFIPPHTYSHHLFCKSATIDLQTVTNSRVSCIFEPFTRRHRSPRCDSSSAATHSACLPQLFPQSTTQPSCQVTSHGSWTSKRRPAKRSWAFSVATLHERIHKARL